MLKICTNHGILDIRDYRMVTPSLSPTKGVLSNSNNNNTNNMSIGKSLHLSPTNFRPSKRMSAKHIILSENENENAKLFNELLNMKSVDENNETDFEDNNNNNNQSKLSVTSDQNIRQSGLSVAIAKKKKESMELLNKESKNNPNKTKSKIEMTNNKNNNNIDSNIDTLASTTEYQRLTNDYSDDELVNRKNQNNSDGNNQSNSIFSCFCCV